MYTPKREALSGTGSGAAFGGLYAVVQQPGAFLRLCQSRKPGKKNPTGKSPPCGGNLQIASFPDDRAANGSQLPRKPQKKPVTTGKPPKLAKFFYAAAYFPIFIITRYLFPDKQSLIFLPDKIPQNSDQSQLPQAVQVSRAFRSFSRARFSILDT
jgi:hypothetical protein